MVVHVYEMGYTMYREVCPTILYWLISIIQAQCIYILWKYI